MPDSVELIKEMRSDIKKIMYILNGNGEPGLVARVKTHDDFVKEFLSTRHIILVTIFRAFISLLLTYVAWKAGINQWFM